MGVSDLGKQFLHELKEAFILDNDLLAMAECDTKTVNVPNQTSSDQHLDPEYCFKESSSCLLVWMLIN